MFCAQETTAKCQGFSEGQRKTEELTPVGGDEIGRLHAEWGPGLSLGSDEGH